MIILDTALVAPAEEAGISIPYPIYDYDSNIFKHWDVFLKMQIGRPMPSANSHWENAKIIAGISDENIRLVTPNDLDRLGYQ